MQVFLPMEKLNVGQQMHFYNPNNQGTKAELQG